MTDEPHTLTLDTHDGRAPKVLHGYTYPTRTEAEDWARRFAADRCHSQRGWTYGVVRL